jgi:hypothetical protein
MDTFQRIAVIELASTSMRYALLVLGLWLLGVALIAVIVSTATVLWMPNG